jgi:hypothetical protein
MDPTSLLYLSRRVSAKTGDLRRALQVAQCALLAARHTWCDAPAAPSAAAPGLGGAGGGGGGGGGGDDDGGGGECDLLGEGEVGEDTREAECGKEGDDEGGEGGARQGGGEAVDDSTGGSSALDDSGSASPWDCGGGSDGGDMPPCRCCAAGTAWLHPPAHPPPPSGSGSGASGTAAAAAAAAAAAQQQPPPAAAAVARKPQAFALSMRELVPVMDALDRSYTGMLQALPRQGLLLLLAARALAEKEAREATAQREAREYAANPHHLSNIEGASTAAPHSDTAAAAAAAEPPAGSNPISLAMLARAYTRMCRRRLVTPVTSNMVIELVDRLLDEGMLAMQSGSGGGGSGGGGGGGGGGTRKSGAASGSLPAAAVMVGASGKGLSAGAFKGAASAIRTLRVKVQLADLDVALAGSPLYLSLAADVRNGVV